MFAWLEACEAPLGPAPDTIEHHPLKAKEA